MSIHHQMAGPASATQARNQKIDPVATNRQTGSRGSKVHRTRPVTPNDVGDALHRLRSSTGRGTVGDGRRSSRSYVLPRMTMRSFSSTRR